MRKFLVLILQMCFIVYAYGVDVYAPFSNETPSNRYVQHNYKATRIRYNKTTYTSQQGQGYKVFSNFFSEHKTSYISGGGRGYTTTSYSTTAYKKQNNYQVQNCGTYTFNTTSITSNNNISIDDSSEKTNGRVIQKAVSQGTWRDWIKYTFGIDPTDGGYIINEDGQLIKITEEDWEAYKNDPDYKDWIDGGGIGNYETYQEEYSAPFGDCPILLLGIASLLYALFKFKHLKV